LNKAEDGAGGEVIGAYICPELKQVAIKTHLITKVFALECIYVLKKTERNLKINDTMTHISTTVQLRSTERNGFTRQIPIVSRSQSRVLILREE
jgi:hypothetical protein